MIFLKIIYALFILSRLLSECVFVLQTVVC